MDKIIGAGVLGFLLGLIVMAIGVMKDLDRMWDDAFEAGEQYGAETERIRQELDEKERVAFSELSAKCATGGAHWEVSKDGN